MTIAQATSIRRNWLWFTILLACAIGMLCLFLFGFSAFYRTWCKYTGTALSPNNPEFATTAATTGGREVLVYFEGQAYDNLPVRFYPDKPAMTVTMGADGKNIYHFKNLSDRVLYFRPVHTVSPISAARQFVMTVCFCFNNQVIQPGETKDFPVVFRFAPGLDERVSTVTLRYSLFEIKPGEGRTDDQKRMEEALKNNGGIVSPGFDSSIDARPKPADGKKP